MQIHSIYIENFKALRGKRTFNPPEGIVGLVGPNGSGKSTVANAIAWCLYGPEVLPTGKADVITWGEKEAIVELDFSVGGDRYRTRRWQGRPPLGGARIDSEAGPVAVGLSDTLRAVGALLAADRVAFLSSVFSRQEELSALSSLTPANRMRTVLRLLGVDELTGAIESTRAESREKGRTLTNLKSSLGDIKQLEGNLEDNKRSARKIGKNISLLEHDLEKSSAESIRLKDRMADLSTKIAEYNDYKLIKSQGNSSVNAALQSLKEILEFAGKLQIVPERGQPREPNLDELSTLENDIRFFNRRLSEISIELSSTSTECPVCKRPYDNEEQLRQHKESLSKEKIDLEEIVKSYSETVQDIMEESAEYQKWVEYDNTRNQQIEEYKRVQVAIWRVYDEYRRLQTETNLIIGPHDVNLEIESIQEEAARIESEKNSITVDLAVAKERLSSVNRETDRLEQELAAQRILVKEIEQQEHSLRVSEITAKELSAFKDKVIASAIPAIELRASALLSEMTGGMFTELSLSPDYDIRYRNNLGEVKEYANLSGGERDVFALALRLALSELRADRIGILFLDEVLESLDEDRQELVWSTLERLTRRYSQIFVVTHVEKFRDRMPYLL